ncbi:hypothetical protein CTAYLR_004531 [Chrysophaeum taylorii]|uniref:Nudix hydrolase domain-containing protein n=1 Tax=Chrysophaeum taylorii TaxID=2483200 RepID=A0AAD7XQ51_9STRA|nr:hypothetical protein CTAYLR_004531 [Chrysophaeum taylorii]
MRAIGALAQCMAARASARGEPVALLDSAAQAKVLRRAENGARRAAVLVPIVSVGGEASVVLSVRSGKVSTHRHQVSFPGGHIESGETAIEAAFREAAEEFGGNFREGFARVDSCTDVLAVTGTVVTPIVAVRDDDLALDAIHPNEEVDTIFALSIAHLLDEQNRELKRFDHRGEMPVFHGGPAPVWGLTAFILDGVLNHVVRPCWDDYDDR